MPYLDFISVETNIIGCSAINSGHVAAAEREGAVPSVQTARFSHRQHYTNVSCISLLTSLVAHRSEKEARKFNAKLLRRQTALENQVEQLSNALKDLTEERRSSSAELSPATTVQGSDPDRSSSTGSLHRSLSAHNMDAHNMDVDYPLETGGVLRLEADGESIYIGAGGSSWALQQVS